jgi:hypothetical protein
VVADTSTWLPHLNLADTDYRARTGRQDSVWVLRVPASQIRRDQLTAQGEQVWVLGNSRTPAALWCHTL